MLQKRILGIAGNELICLIAASSLVTLSVWLLITLVIEFAFNERVSYYLQFFISLAVAFILGVIALVGNKCNFIFSRSFFSRVHSIASDNFIFPENLSFSNLGKHKVSWSVRLGVRLHYFFSQKFLNSILSFFRWIFNNSERINSFLQLLRVFFKFSINFLLSIFSE